MGSHPYPPSIKDIDAIDPAFWKRYEEDHKWPPGTFRNIVDQIENNPPGGQIEGSTDLTGGPVPPQHVVEYDPDELAAYDFYKNAYSEKQWTDLVASYEANGGGAQPTPGADPVKPGFDANGRPTAGKFDENATYISHDDKGFAAPEPGKWTGEGDPNSEVSVNVQALIWMADQLKPLTEGGSPIDEAVRRIEGVDPAPGGFARAEILRQKIVGAGGQGGLKQETKDMLMAVRSTAFQIQEGLRALAKNYQDAEELNNLTSDDLNKVMNAGWRSGNKISEYGKEVTSEGA